MRHTCGITTGGDLYCWGNGDRGALGDGNTSSHRVMTPILINSGKKFAKISAGALHNCAIDTHGETYCWGSGIVGQTGNGSTSDASVPTLISGGHQFSEISSGVFTTCGLKANGEVYCWGEGDSGQRGDGTTDFVGATPVKVDTTIAFNSISVGETFACATTAEKRLYCWGDLDALDVKRHTRPHLMNYTY